MKNELFSGEEILCDVLWVSDDSEFSIPSAVGIGSDKLKKYLLEIEAIKIFFMKRSVYQNE